MTNITLSKKKIDTLPKKYTRLVLTEEKQGLQRYVETANGNLELHMGCGKHTRVDARHFRTLLRSAVQFALAQRISHLALTLNPNDFPKLTKYTSEWFYQTVGENLCLAAYTFTKYKTQKTKEKQLQEVLICADVSPSEKRAFTKGVIVAQSANIARDIANTSAADMTPTKLAHAAKKAVAQKPVRVRVLNEKELQKLKMGLLLAVGAGTKHDTKLIVMEYWGAGKPQKGKVKKSQKPIVYVGKGITYDTGGLNVKPSGHMHDMHLDMSGGAAVIGTLAALAQLRLKKNVIGIIPAAENAISDSSMRAGDIVKAMNGKTVEVLHTDAEGRMVLADALSYSERYNPQVIVDVATLTGASLVALGQHASAVLSKDKKLQETLLDLGEISGDYLWPLPLWDEYQQYLKSSRADISNIATNFSRFGGVIEGAAFLQNFAPKKVPWAHLDIAPRMEAIASDKLAKGATGEPVRLLTRFAETY